MRHVPASIEQLENRQLLAGVTIITHGRQPDSSRPQWLDSMKDSLVARLGAQTAVYAMRIARINDGSQATVTSFELISGIAPSTSNNAEVVLMLDWADASGVVTGYFNTADLAKQLVEPYLLDVYPSKGISKPLAEMPIHLIGHSRGASLVSALAHDLGENGIWVDQLTTLDAYPIAPDPEVVVGKNVLFADNYYETTGYTSVPLVYLAGEPVAGAHNTNLTVTNGVQYHEDVHNFYDTTIDQASVPGFYYSRAIAGARPADGVGSEFFGSGSRSAIARTGSQWPDIGEITIDSANTLAIGQKIDVSYLYQSGSANSTISWFADKDTNPYTGAISFGSSPTTTSNLLVYSSGVQLTPGALPAGQWRIGAKISDAAGHVRYAYAPSTITLTEPPDVTKPTATLSSAPNISVASTGAYSFTVNYSDNKALNVSTLDSSDILVTGPQNYSSMAQFVSIGNASGTARAVTYRIVPPGGSWDLADNGAYTISVRPNSVFDASGNALATKSLGGFQVQIPVISDTAGSEPWASRSIGTMSVGRIRSILEAVGQNDRNDVFKLTLTSSTLLSIKLSNLAGNADLQLLDAAGNRLLYSKRGGVANESLSSARSKGTYYVRVLYRGAGETPYRLRFEAKAPIAAVSRTMATPQPPNALIARAKHAIFSDDRRIDVLSFI